MTSRFSTFVQEQGWLERRLVFINSLIPSDASKRQWTNQHWFRSSFGLRQAMIWTNAGILLIGRLGTEFSEILFEIYTFSFTKVHFKMSSGPQCFELIRNRYTSWPCYNHTKLHLCTHPWGNHTTALGVVKQSWRIWQIYNITWIHKY